MAKVTDVMISGTLANIVFYRRMGKNCMRLKRDRIQQSAATKARSTNFGIAAGAGRILRQGLAPVLPVPTDRSMQSRFSGSIAKWLGVSDVHTIAPCAMVENVTGFQLGVGIIFSDFCTVPITVSTAAPDVLTVTIASFNPVESIRAPQGTLYVKLIASVAGCVLQPSAVTGNTEHTVTIPYADTSFPSQILNTTISMPPGGLTVTAIRLQYYTGSNDNLGKITDIAWMPAVVLNACYS